MVTFPYVLVETVLRGVYPRVIYKQVIYLFSYSETRGRGEKKGRLKKRNRDSLVVEFLESSSFH